MGPTKKNPAMPPRIAPMYQVPLGIATLTPEIIPRKKSINNLNVFTLITPLYTAVEIQPTFRFDTYRFRQFPKIIP